MERVTTIAELVLADPGAARALEALGIDTCCQADRTLDEACLAAGVGRHEATTALAAAAAARAPVEGSLLDRLEALVAGHRDLRRTIDRVGALADVVARSHGAQDRAASGLARDLHEVSERLAAHAATEEAALFARVSPAQPRELHREALAVERLRRDLRALAEDWAATPRRCPTERALLEHLRAVEQALADHADRQRALEVDLAARARP